MSADSVRHHIVTAVAARHKEGRWLCGTQWVRAKASLECSAARSVVVGRRRGCCMFDGGVGGCTELGVVHRHGGSVSRRRGGVLRCRCSRLRRRSSSQRIGSIGTQCRDGASDYEVQIGRIRCGLPRHP
eukprot:5227021-Pleurochrysis_carterae.AAC.2